MSTVGNTLENAFIRDFAKVSALNFRSDTVEGSTKSILRRSANHLGSDGSSVRGPSEEDDFVTLALTWSKFVFEIVNSVSAVLFGELAEESVIVGVRRLFFDNNLGLVVADLVDDEFDLVSAQLQFVVCIESFVINSNTRRHCELSEINN